MNRLKSSLIAFFGLMALIGVIATLTPTTSKGQGGGSKEVIVVNTPDVNVINTPTVKAQQDGAWNVGLTGTPTVQVGNAANDPVLVRDVENPARQPFQQSVSLNLGNDEPFAIGFIFVPAGKRLVIEYASADAQMASDQRVKISIRTTLNIFPKIHFLVMHYQGTFSGFDTLVAGQEVRLYADPGTSVAVQVVRLATSGSGLTATVAISGYFVDVP